MDTIVKKIAGIGVPGLVLLVALHLTGLVGAAAITTALAALGPGGMIGGIMTLIVIGAASDGIAQFGFDAIAKGVLRELYCKGETKDSLKKKIKKYPVSSKLKTHLYEVVENFTVTTQENDNE